MMTRCCTYIHPSVGMKENTNYKCNCNANFKMDDCEVNRDVNMRTEYLMLTYVWRI